MLQYYSIKRLIIEMSHNELLGIVISLYYPNSKLMSFV